jgi:glycosyltransferase involved in cell wall biosynthesis
MKIDFIINSLGVYGSVRELIENGNQLSKLGHDVTVWTNDGVKCGWLTQNFRTKSYKGVTCKTDALILMDSPHSEQFRFFEKSKAKFKTMVMMGFDPDTFYQFIDAETYDNLGVNPKETEQNLRYILKTYEVCADGQWQIDYLKNIGIKVGVSIGGVNTNMFYPSGKKTKNVAISGDMRARKGTPILKEVLKDVYHYEYKGTIDQKELQAFYASSEIYIDNHNRAGWCNPVLEAMACGCAVICSNIGAVQDFAIEGQTAIVVEKNNIEAFNSALNYLISNPKEIKRLSKNAAKKAKEFDYSIISKRFEQYLKTKI